MSETRDNKLVVFRMGKDDEWRLSELQQGRLRQGWGHPTLRLLDEAGKPVDRNTWNQNHREIGWGEPSPRRFSILSRMLYLKKGDIVVIPKLPEWNVFTIARVNDSYRFEMADGWDDFGHIVPVDPASVRQFNYHADDDAFLISGLFSQACHWSPVSFCSKERHIEVASKLLGKKENLTAQPQESLIESRINKAFKEAAKSMQKEVGAWTNGHRFQAAVAQAFLNQGYEVEGRNKSDGKGGDIDILVSPPPQFSFFLPDQIAVQVKWKQGIDRYDEKAVEQIVKGVESLGNDAAKYVISSASGFTEEAKKKAEENDVIIILGLQTMAFLLGFPDQYREEWEENE